MSHLQKHQSKSAQTKQYLCKCINFYVNRRTDLHIHASKSSLRLICYCCHYDRSKNPWCLSGFSDCRTADKVLNSDSQWWLVGLWVLVMGLVATSVNQLELFRCTQRPRHIRQFQPIRNGEFGLKKTKKTRGILFSSQRHQHLYRP